MKSRSPVFATVKLPRPTCGARMIAAHLGRHRKRCAAPPPAPVPTGPRCGCGAAARYELRARGVAVRLACGDCAESAPLATHVRPLAEAIA